MVRSSRLLGPALNLFSPLDEFELVLSGLYGLFWLLIWFLVILSTALAVSASPAVFLLEFLASDFNFSFSLNKISLFLSNFSIFSINSSRDYYKWSLS